MAGRHPDATLVVDESYNDFCPDPAGASVIGCDLPNVVVLRSPTKFYGIAAARTGVAWCADRRRLARLVGEQENWGLSGIDARVACAALESWDWSAGVRAQLHDDNRWLAEALADWHDLKLWPNANVHFQFGWTDRAGALAGGLAAQGIGVRPLGAAHGVRPGALRIVAPRLDERERFAGALRTLRGGRVLTATPS